MTLATRGTDCATQRTLDDFTRLAGRLLGVPVVYLSLVAARGRMVASSYGRPVSLALLLCYPFCRHIAASRRPVRTAVLQEVFRSRRWVTNRRVRKALAQNPYTPPSLAISALAILTAPDLREIASDGTVSSEVRVQARLLLAHRTGAPTE